VGSRIPQVAGEATKSFGKDIGIQCSVCWGLLADPMETCCGHLFCRDCLGQSPFCPTCRSSLADPTDEDKRKVSPASAAFQRLLAGLKVRCPNPAKEPAVAPSKRKKATAPTPQCDWLGRRLGSTGLATEHKPAAT
jgi:hypothetical protein